MRVLAAQGSCHLVFVRRIQSRAWRSCIVQGEPSGGWLEACRSRKRRKVDCACRPSIAQRLTVGLKGTSGLLELGGLMSGPNKPGLGTGPLPDSKGPAHSCRGPTIPSSRPSGWESGSSVHVSPATYVGMFGGSKASLFLLRSLGEGVLCAAKQGSRTGQGMWPVFQC